jgi:hypothetical protein
MRQLLRDFKDKNIVASSAAALVSEAVYKGSPFSKSTGHWKKMSFFFHTGSRRRSSPRSRLVWLTRPRRRRTIMQVLDQKETCEAVAVRNWIKAIVGMTSSVSLAVRPRYKTSLPDELHLARRCDGSALLLDGMSAGLDDHAVTRTEEHPVTKGR